MVATIRKRKTKDGKRRYQAIVRRRGVYRIGTFGSKEAAEEWGRRVETDIDRLRIDGFVDRSVAEAVERYLGFDPLKKSKEDKAKRVYSHDLLEHATSDHKNIIHRLGWWVSRLGSVGLRDLSPALLRETWDRIPGKPSTRNRYLAALSTVLTTATREWQWMPANPCASLTYRRENNQRVRRLTNEEREALLAACLECHAGRVLHAMVFFALETGCRLGEIERLTHRDVHRDAEEILIQTSKNGDPRAVFISPELDAVLERVPPRGDGLVFGHLPMKGWRKARKKAKLDGWRFHDLRHDFASGLGDRGFAEMKIAESLGHRTSQMARRYTHHLPAIEKERMRRYHAEKVASRQAKPPIADGGRTPDPQAPDAV